MSDISENKTAIVTGGGSGIGRACALALVAEGWNVAILGRRQEALDETLALAEANAGQIMSVSCDVTDEAQVDAAFAKVVETFGRLDLLFNNAGAFIMAKTIDELPVADWKRIVDVNLNGAFLCARAAFRQFKAQSPQGGRIINNGSISAYVPRPGSVGYTATKHAITGLTRTLALDGRPFNIACGQIDIGNASSDMTDAMKKGVAQADGSVKPEAVMDVSHVASSLIHMASLPLDANVLFMTVMATQMPYVGRG